MSTAAGRSGGPSTWQDSQPSRTIRSIARRRRPPRPAAGHRSGSPSRWGIQRRGRSHVVPPGREWGRRPRGQEVRLGPVAMSAVAPTMSRSNTWLIQSRRRGGSEVAGERDRLGVPPGSGVRRNRSMSARRKRYSDCLGSPTKNSWPGPGAPSSPASGGTAMATGRCRAAADRCPGTRPAAAPGSAAPAHRGMGGRPPDLVRRRRHSTRRSWKVSRPGAAAAVWALVQREAGQLIAQGARIGFERKRSITPAEGAAVVARAGPKAIHTVSRAPFEEP